MILILFLMACLESFLIYVLLTKYYFPVKKLWKSIEPLDFRRKTVDFSMLDNLEPSQGVVGSITMRFKSLTDIICERINTVNRVRSVSEHDGLTGCYNVQRLKTEKNRYEHSDNFIIIFIDVNNLKRMNDTLGHEAGDALIKDAASHIKYWDEYGDVYRIGGDEFMVVLPDMDSKKAKRMIPQWHKGVGVLAETPEGFKCVLSYGVAEGQYGDSFDDIQKEADDQMYEMKVKIKKKLGEPMR